MLKILIATFSQSGSTQKVAGQIAGGLSESGFEVTQMKITKEKPQNISGYDIIGIGTPVYFFRTPFVVDDFLDAIPGMKGKSFFVFVTHGTSRGDCGNRLRRKLKAKGGRDLGYFHCFGADYWMGYIKRGTLFSPDSPDEVELAHARRFGQKIAQRYAGDFDETDHFDDRTHFVYRFEQIFVSRPMARYVFTSTFSADKRCDQCGLCLENCPVANIEKTAEGKLVWGSNCLLCAGCELCCPKDAIHSGLDWLVFAPFMHYNIRRSKRKGIPYVTVSHTKGKTEIIDVVG